MCIRDSFYILYFDTLAKAITVTPISKAMLGLSITQYYANFTIGLIDLPSVLFMLTLTLSLIHIYQKTEKLTAGR